MMSSAQPGILAPVSRFSRFLFFDLAEGQQPAEALSRIQACAADEDLVLGIGPSLVPGSSQQAAQAGRNGRGLAAGEREQKEEGSEAEHGARAQSTPPIGRARAQEGVLGGNFARDLPMRGRGSP